MVFYVNLTTLEALVSWARRNSKGGLLSTNLGFFVREGASQPYKYIQFHDGAVSRCLSATPEELEIANRRKDGPLVKI